MSDAVSSPDSLPTRPSEVLALLFAMAFPAVLTWTYFLALGQSPPGAQQTAYAAGKVIQFGFPVVWVAWVRRERLRAAGPGKGTAEGLAFGAAVLGIVLAGYHLWLGPSGLLDAAGTAVRERLAGFAIDTPARYAALAAFYSLGHSFLEEYYWRWFVFGRLCRLAPAGAAIGLSSLAFTAHHVIVLGHYFGWRSPACWLFSLAVAAGGAYWAWLYQRSGSLWGPWLGHLAIDAAIFAVGYDLAGIT